MLDKTKDEIIKDLLNEIQILEKAYSVVRQQLDLSKEDFKQMAHNYECQKSLTKSLKKQCESLESDLKKYNT